MEKMIDLEDIIKELQCQLQFLRHIIIKVIIVKVQEEINQIVKVDLGRVQEIKIEIVLKIEKITKIKIMKKINLKMISIHLKIMISMIHIKKKIKKNIQIIKKIMIEKLIIIQIQFLQIIKVHLLL